MTETRTYKIAGLSCIDCAGRIQAAVGQLEGVEQCAVDHATGKLTVWFAAPDSEVASDFDIAPIAQIVEETGHSLVAERRRTPGGHPLVQFVRFLLASRETTLTVTAGAVTLVGLALALAGVRAIAPTLLFAAAIAVGSLSVVKHAFQEVWIAHSLGINTLMVIAVSGAMVIGEWAEAAIVVVLFALGEALEGYAVERARSALESLLDLAPPSPCACTPMGQPWKFPWSIWPSASVCACVPATASAWMASSTPGRAPSTKPPSPVRASRWTKVPATTSSRARSTPSARWKWR